MDYRQKIGFWKIKLKIVNENTVVRKSTLYFEILQIS